MLPGEVAADTGNLHLDLYNMIKSSFMIFIFCPADYHTLVEIECTCAHMIMTCDLVTANSKAPRAEVRSASGSDNNFLGTVKWKTTTLQPGACIKVWN